MFIYCLYICVPIGVFVVFSLLQLIMDAAHEPYIKINEDKLTVFLYQQYRTSGNYMEYLYKNKNGKWRYQIDTKEIVVYIFIYVVLFLAAYYFIGDSENFIEAIGVVTEGYISYILVMPVRAFSVMKKELKKLKEKIED